jgi:hypothetical protein
VLQEQAPRAAAAVPLPGVSDPPAPRSGDEAPAPSVRQQAEHVLHFIQYGTSRKDVCDIVRRGNLGVGISRGELAFKLDELHILSLKPSVLLMEPKSAGEIGRMKSWAMSNLARPGPMALVDAQDPLRIHCVKADGSGCNFGRGECGGRGVCDVLGP